ncbi:hypothetical protein BM525_19435 (plasmid) [Alteromonas mediterranea]|uniref:Uncharacterized protein n=1 Tax=Alteromonas mediterranea TaxID=314275 RepID=A0AAC9NU40_9ALTE|nr:hypothetical protein [Alteromonas mediterranea]APD92057.1 hypothetical protein BM524_19240 [Alteromonas mediterranea]APD99911.1 hypothetical protein BM525_19435 [Alteromonas mediterranea]
MTLLCRECGNEMQINENGVSNHLDDGLVDYDQDADHVAITDEYVLMSMNKEATVMSLQKDKSNSLFHAIKKLAANSAPEDKEVSIYQTSLEIALKALKGNEKALSDIAKAVNDELGDDIDDISYMDCESEIKQLVEVINTPN